MSDQQTRLLIGHLHTVLTKDLEGSILAVSMMRLLPLLLFPRDIILEIVLGHLRVYVLGDLLLTYQPDMRHNTLKPTHVVYLG